MLARPKTSNIHTYSLCERVYIHNTYMKNRKSCSETQRKFRVKFPGRPVSNPSTIRRQAKRFKETGSVMNRKVNRQRHVLTEEILDEIGERLEHAPKISKTFIAGNRVVCTESNKITEITYTYCEYTHVHTMRIPIGMSEIAIITITTLTALTYNNNHNQ